MGDIEERTDGFYFWDECGLYDYGPYKTAEEAYEQLKAYARTLEDN